MDPACNRANLLKFGIFEVDLKNRELRKAGIKQKLAGQPFQVLRALIEKSGQVVTREELRDLLWSGNTFVDYDLALKKAVNRLRDVLGDSADSPRFIETIPRQGYRFLAQVQAIESPHASYAVETRAHWKLAVGLTCAIATAVLLGLNANKLRTRIFANSRSPEIQSIAVLPLQNLSPDSAQDYFSDGMTDALITDLAQIGSLKVISRTSSMQYKQTKKSLPEVARELNVDGIVEGTVQRSGDHVRITAQLVQGPSDKHLWANSYERNVSDVFALEREVAGDIARQVQARLTTENHAQLEQPRPINPAALEAYLQGNSHMHKFSRGFGDEELHTATEYFRQAIHAEPDFAPAYVGMSKARRMTLRSSSEDIEIASKAADRALELDPNLSDAWAAQGDIRFDFWDWSGAEQDYRQALALNPNDATAHERLGFLLDAFGRLDEGWKEAEIAQQLDPNEEHLEPALCNRHEYDQIIKRILTMLDADPDNGLLHYGLYEAYAEKGMYKEAMQHLEQTFVLFGFPESAAKVRRAFATSGYKGAMQESARELEYLHATNQLFIPVNLALTYVEAGDKDRAFYWLEQAYKRRGHGSGGMSIVFVNREPMLEPLHSDPRYKDLLRRVGLPP